MNRQVSTNTINPLDLMAKAQDFLDFVGSQKDGISFEELRLELGGIRGCPQPKLARTTLLYWLKSFNFPVQKGGYKSFHIEKLSAFALYLRSTEREKKRGTTNGFKGFWNEYQNYKRTKNEPRQSTTTVTVESQPVF